jgi:hypothetical protein
MELIGYEVLALTSNPTKTIIRAFSSGTAENRYQETYDLVASDLSAKQKGEAISYENDKWFVASIVIIKNTGPLIFEGL